MAFRRLYAYGMIAGLSYTEMRRLEPGFVIDLVRIRTDYDIRLAAPGAARRALGG